MIEKLKMILIEGEKNLIRKIPLMEETNRWRLINEGWGIPDCADRIIADFLRRRF